MLNNFKWYRRLAGGVWYYNRYVVDSGNSLMYYWERKQRLGHDIKTEDYTK